MRSIKNLTVDELLESYGEAQSQLRMAQYIDDGSSRRFEEELANEKIFLIKAELKQRCGEAINPQGSGPAPIEERGA